MFIQSACETYGWSIEYTLDQPILMLMLMLRQKTYLESNGKAMTLLQLEDIAEQKDIPWEELVRRNREKLAKQMSLLT